MQKLFALIFIASFGYSSMMNHFSIEGNLNNPDIIQFSLGEIQISNNNEIYKFDYNYTGYVIEEGMPELPVFSTLFQIDPGFNYSIEYEIKNYTTLKNKPIRATGELTLNKQKHESGLNRTLTRQSVFPEDIVKISEPLVMRGVELVKIEVIPFQYNPITNDLISYDEIEIRLIKENQRELIRNRIISKDKINDLIFEASVLNFSRTTTEFNPPAILFICGGSIAEENSFQQLVDWKHKRGYEVTVESLSSIGSSTINIKNYIQNAYDNWENPPSFICLVGDATGNYSIPTYTEYQSGYNGEGDHPYTQLDGNDLISDVALGRLPVRSTDDMETISAKVIGYEKAYTNYQNQNEWFERGALVGDPSDSGISTIITNEYIEQLLENNNFDDIRTNYGNGSYSSWMRNQLSDGVLYFNYRGFYGVSGFNNSDVNNTNNGFKLPFVSVITCGTGSFRDESTCLSEKFVVAGTSTNPKGGVVAIGTSTTGTHTMFNNAVNLGVFEGIFTHELTTAGEALNYGKLHLINSYLSQTETYTSIFCHWHNLMGDPSLNLWTDTPFEPTVSYPEIIGYGANNIVVNVIDENGLPVENAIVTLLKGNDEIFTSKLTGENGEVLIALDYSSAGNVSVTVTKKNMIPFEGEFEISNGISSAFLNEELIVFTEVIGNSNGDINPGETISLSLPIENTGNSEIQNLSAELITSSEHITINSANSNYGFGYLAIGETGSNNTLFEIEIDSNVKDSENLELTLLIFDGENNWESTLSLDVKGAHIEIGNLIINGNGHNLNSNGNSYLTLVLNNNGRFETGELIGELTPLSAGINVNTSTINWNNISANTSLSPSSTIEIEVMTGVVNGTMTSFKLDLIGNNNFEQSMTFNLQAGLVTSLDPLGPDSYGYYIYDSGDVEYDLAPIYDWIELDPDHGGDGNDINMSDNGDNQDEVIIVDLPFTFRFYGIDYNVITICSNGWIAFGETDMRSFRNYNLPGAGGPSPMLAVFWDDLINYSNFGGIFTKYISPISELEPGKFVIEWSDMRTFDENSPETFQAILYQNSVLPNFDNEIKLQYKEFNNTTNGSLGGWSTGPVHGAYCTVGIENNSGLIGLEYTFNNTYPTAGMTISDGTALYITTQTGEALPPAILNISDSEINYNLNYGEIGLGQLIIGNDGDEGSILMYSINQSHFLNPGGETDILGMNWSDSDREPSIHYEWIDIDEDGEILEFPHNDQSADELEIAFEFPFYDEIYSTLIVNANGWIGFGNDNTTWGNTAIPSNEGPRPAIFAYWDDLNPISDGGGCSGVGSGVVYYQSTANNTIITFSEVAYCSGADNGLYTFQVILEPSGKIKINYKEMLGLINSGTIGIQNENGSIGHQVIYNSNYVHNNLQLVFEKETSWLELQGALNGQIMSGNNEIVDYSLNAENLLSGEYLSYISISTNAAPVQIIPVILSVDINSGMLGDVNNDSLINVSDIVAVVSYILGQLEPSSYQEWASDINDDGVINVVDIIVMVDIVLGN
jgi:hypothetical protein